VVPNAVVRDAGVGGKQRPEQAELAAVLLFSELGAEAPIGEQRASPVDWAVPFDDQAGKVGKAAFFNVSDVGISEGFQIEGLAGQRMDQHRLSGPTHLGPQFFRPLRAVRGGCPPVGALDVSVALRWYRCVEQHFVQCARGAALMAFRVTQNHERLFRGVM